MDVWEESGMMVELVKQVHLQKEGGEAAILKVISRNAARSVVRRFMTSSNKLRTGWMQVDLGWKLQYRTLTPRMI